MIIDPPFFCDYGPNIEFKGFVVRISIESPPPIFMDVSTVHEFQCNGMNIFK